MSRNSRTITCSSFCKSGSLWLDFFWPSTSPWTKSGLELSMFPAAAGKGVPVVHCWSVWGLPDSSHRESSLTEQLSERCNTSSGKAVMFSGPGNKFSFLKFKPVKLGSNMTPARELLNIQRALKFCSPLRFSTVGILQIVFQFLCWSALTQQYCVL